MIARALVTDAGVFLNGATNGEYVTNTGHSLPYEGSEKKASGLKRKLNDCKSRLSGPHVHVEYHGLTRESKGKLESLLQAWAVWQADRDDERGPRQLAEGEKEGETLSGRCVVFPALPLPRHTLMKFWMDIPQPPHTSSAQARAGGGSKGFNAEYDAGNQVPLYDRGTPTPLAPSSSASSSSSSSPASTREGGAGRCFNCGSYVHSLKECKRRLDRAAIGAARERQQQQHPAGRRGGTSASRGPPPRYHESAQEGAAGSAPQFDDLTPGTLSAELRSALGLQDLDPPPWLQRMRQLGIPPAYQDVSHWDDDTNDDDHDGDSIVVVGDAEAPSVVNGSAEVKREEAEAEEGEMKEEQVEEPPKRGVAEPVPGGTKHQQQPQQQPAARALPFPGVNAPPPPGADPHKWVSHEPPAAALMRPPPHPAVVIPRPIYVPPPPVYSHSHSGAAVSPEHSGWPTPPPHPQPHLQPHQDEEEPEEGEMRQPQPTGTPTAAAPPPLPQYTPPPPPPPPPPSPSPSPSPRGALLTPPYPAPTSSWFQAPVAYDSSRYTWAGRAQYSNGCNQYRYEADPSRWGVQAEAVQNHHQGADDPQGFEAWARAQAALSAMQDAPSPSAAGGSLVPSLPRVDSLPDMDVGM